MSKDIYDDINELLIDVKKDIRDVLEEEVLNEVKDIELKHINNDVYKYKPKIYERRLINGISDPDNIVGTIQGDMELEIDNITQFNDGYSTSNHGLGLPQLINDGDDINGYYYDYPGEFNQPRPFLDNTEEEVERSNRIDDALEKGLRNRGYTVKNA